MNDEPVFGPQRQRVLWVLAGLAWMAGCASDKGAPPPSAPSPVPVPPPAGGAPAAAPAAPPLAPSPPPPPPVDVPQALRAAADLLQEGGAAAALELAQRVLAVEPRNAQALSYVRQIETEPVTLLGRESHAYVVRPGESLSSIARDRLRDPYLFYALARYNHIKVPKQLAAGQTIRVPGRAPVAAAPAPASPPASPPAATPAPAATPGATPVATPAPSVAPAPAPVPAPPASTPSPPAPAPPAPEPMSVRINALMREGRGHMARQDLCNAVRSFDKVLELDPNHGPARSERQRALDLIERLRKQGSRLDC